MAGDFNVNAWRNEEVRAGGGAGLLQSIRAEDGRREPAGEYAATLAGMLGGRGFEDAHGALPLPPQTQTCAYDATTPHERHTCFYPAQPGDVVAPRTLDYIWHSRGNLSVKSADLVRSSGASDHHALRASLVRI